MNKYGIVTSYTTSLQVVAGDIAYTLRKLGCEVKIYDRPIYAHQIRKYVNRAIVFIPFDPLYCTIWCLLQRDYKLSNIGSIIYVTIEGKPKPHLIREWIKRDCNFIANSNFTRDMLESVNIYVDGVIPHGVNLDIIKKVVHNARRRNKEFKQRLNVKTVFGTVCSDHPRKGLDLLAQTIEKVNEKNDDIGFVVITKTGGAMKLKKLKNTLVLSRFGTLARSEILSYIGGFDYYLNPTLAEGFGLPLLEANALGVPCIYPDYAPLNEIIKPEHNYPVEIAHDDYVDFGDGILYKCHYYSTDEMAERIIEAHHTHVNEPEKYRKLSDAVKRDAERYNILNVYREFMDGWRW